MKILKFVILISFLFNSVAYPYENNSNTLRPPMLGDKENKDRLESAGKLASGQNIGARDQKEKFSLQDYRPGWTFEGWGQAKKAIERKFTSTKERKEALQSVRTFARKLAENEIDPYFTLINATAVAEAARNVNEFELFLNLGIKLAENKMYPDSTLIDAIPAVAEVAKNTDELELFLNLGIKLAENKIFPDSTLKYVIPAVAKAAEELQSIEKLKLFIEAMTMLVERKKDYYLTDNYPLNYKFIKTARNVENMQDLIIEAAKETVAVKTKIKAELQPEAQKFITNEDIEKALALKEEFGDFAVRYYYRPEQGHDEYNGQQAWFGDHYIDIADWVVDVPESCDIQILPPISTGTKLVSGQTVEGNIKPPSVGQVEPVADAYAAIQKGDYDKAYELVMEGLLGEDYVVNMDTAIGILKELSSLRFNVRNLDTYKRAECSIVLEIVTKYQKVSDQKQMKTELRKVRNEVLPTVMSKFEKFEKEHSAISYYIDVKNIQRAVKYQRRYGNFKIIFYYRPGESLPVSEYTYGSTEPQEYSYTVSKARHLLIVLPAFSTGTKLASGQNIGNNPTANLSVLKLTPTLFLDTEVAANPDAFKQGLIQLKSNEGNIPVVLLTEETKDSIIAKLKGIDLTGVQFRTKAELGLQDLEWSKDERVSLIDGIDNLKCIPLTSALCETYKDLQKARDQV